MSESDNQGVTMRHPNFKFQPLTKTQHISVHWVFSQNDYDNIAKGNGSNWCVFLEDETIHICRMTGKEFYRIKLKHQSDGTYLAESLERGGDRPYLQVMREHSNSEEEIEQQRKIYSETALEETAGILQYYFGIDVDGGHSSEAKKP